MFHEVIKLAVPSHSFKPHGHTRIAAAGVRFDDVVGGNSFANQCVSDAGK